MKPPNPPRTVDKSTEAIFHLQRFNLCGGVGLIVKLLPFPTWFDPDPRHGMRGGAWETLRYSKNTFFSFTL